MYIKKKPSYTVPRRQGLLSIDGIWIRAGKNTPLSASTYSMETTTPIHRDVFLAAISVIPASILWIAGGRSFLAALAFGVGIFLAAEYGYPALKSGRIDIEPVLRFISQVRDSIRARATKGA